jgi:DNA-binding MarR family transcriptional regulator
MQRRIERANALESYLAYWVHYVGYRLSHELYRRMQKFGVTAAEWVVLRKLYEDVENGAMPSQLARQLGLTRSAISKLAKRLEAKELLRRTKSFPDRRAKRLTLTTLGRFLVPRLAALADETNARNFRGAGLAWRERIEQVMKWIVRRDRLRFVPPGHCSVIPEYQHGDIDWARDVAVYTWRSERGS